MLLNLLLLPLCQSVSIFHVLRWVGQRVVQLSYIDGCALICIWHQSSASALPTNLPLSRLTSIQFVSNSIFTPSKTPGLQITFFWLVDDMYGRLICWRRINACISYFMFFLLVGNCPYRAMLELIKTLKYEMISWLVIKQRWISLHTSTSILWFNSIWFNFNWHAIKD